MREHDSDLPISQNLMANKRRRPWLRVKPKIPLIGFDDGQFHFRKPSSRVPIVGAVMKGAAYLEGVLQDFMAVDDGITQTILRMLKSSPHLGQIRAILTPGITFGGFSVLDINEIFEELAIPVIVIIPRYPDFGRIRKALLDHFPDGAQRWKLIQKAGKPKLDPSSGLYVQHIGCTFDICSQIIRLTAIQGKVPEPLRVAHLIASGLKYS
ncbi:MAG: endonuclease dU [Candidatus Hodarchaeales archaeon]|jgi:endonuclease V-like protein UPF0215 family